MQAESLTIVKAYMGGEIVASCRWPREDAIAAMLDGIADALCSIHDAADLGDPAKLRYLLFHLAPYAAVTFAIEDCESDWDDPPYIVICRIGAVEGRAIYDPRAMSVIEPDEEAESTALPLALIRAAAAYFQRR